MDLFIRTLLVLAFLWQRTDESHTAAIADIAEYLTEHGIPRPDARTIRKDIAQLVDFGIDIVSARGVQNQYHVASRHFDMPELRLLIDAVQSSSFITTRKGKCNRRKAKWETKRIHSQRAYIPKTEDCML